MSNTATNNILLALKLTTKDFKTEMQGALTLLTNFEKAVKNVKFFPVIDSTSVKNNINTILTQTKDSINQERSAKKASNDEDLKQKRINAQFEKDFNKLVVEEQKAAKRKANQEYEQAFNKLVEAEKRAIAEKIAANKKASQESQQLMDAEFQRLRNNQQKFYTDKSQAEKSFNEILKNNNKVISDAEKQNNAKIAAEKLAAEKALNAIKNNNAKTVQNAPALDLKNQIKDIQARTSALKQDKAELQLNISSLNALKNSIKGNSTEEQKLKHDIDQSIASLNRKKIALDGNINDLNRERLAIQGNQHSIVNQNSAIQTNITELHRQRDALNQTTTASNKAESATKGLAGSFSLSVAAGNLLSKAVTAAYGAMTAEIHKLFEEYIKLESKILSVQGQFGDSVGTYEELGSKIVETADKLSQSGLDAATSFAKFRPIVDDTKLALEGYTQAQIEATAVHAQLSTITKSDINLIKIYGIEVEDLASVHNSLNKAQKFSNATTEEFFRNLPTITIAAGNAGVSIRQMAVEYSILTNTMKSPAIAATSYQALINYIEKSEDLKKRVENLNKSTGSNIKYGASAIRDAGGVLEWARLLKTAFEKTTDASDNFMKSIRLTQAGKAIQGLIAADRPNEQRADKKSLAQRAIEDSKKELNLLKQQYDKSIDTIENRLSGFKNSFNNIWMQFLIRHEKTIKQVMDGTENLINKLMGWGVQFKNFSVEIFNQLKSIFIGTDLSEIGNISIQIMEAIAHSAGNLIRKLVSDLDVLIKTGEYTVAKTRSIWEKANYIRYVATKGKTAADEYVAYFQEQADAKEAAMDLAINKNKRFNEKFFKEFGAFIEPEVTKVIHQKPIEQVPIKLKNQNKEYVAPIAAKNGSIELLDGKKLKEAENQAKKDASLLEKYNSLKSELENELKTLLADNSLKEAIAKVREKYLKIIDDANKDFSHTKSTKTIKVINAVINQAIVDMIAAEKQTKREFKEKTDKIVEEIKGDIVDLHQRIKDISEGSNFNSVFSLDDFLNKFGFDTKKGTSTKSNQFIKELEKNGYSEKDAEKAVKELEKNLSILNKNSREAFKKSKEEFNSKFQQKGDTDLSNSQTDLKDEQLRAKKAKTESLVVFKSSVEDEKVILKERLSAKLNEIDQEKIAKEQQITDEINAQIKKFGKSKDLDQQLKDRLLKLDSQYEVIRETARTKEANDRIALENSVTEKIDALNKETAKSISDTLGNALDPILPGISKIFDVLIDKNKDVREEFIKTGTEIAKALGIKVAPNSDMVASLGSAGANLKSGQTESKIPNALKDSSSSLKDFFEETNTGFTKLTYGFDNTKSEIDAITKTSQLGMAGIADATGEATKATKDFSLETAVIGIVGQQVGNSLTVAWGEVKDMLSGNIRTAEDYQESFMKLAKALPAGMGIIAELLDLPRQAQIKSNKEIEESEKALITAKIELQQDGVKKSLEIENDSFNNFIKDLDKRGLVEKAYRAEREKLELQHSKNIVDIIFASVNEIVTSDNNLKVSRLKVAYETTANKIAIENLEYENTKLAIAAEAKTDAEYKQKSEQAEYTHQSNLNQIRADGFEKAKQLAKDYQEQIDILSDKPESVLKTEAAYRQFAEDMADAMASIFNPAEYGQKVVLAQLKLAASLKQVAESSGKDLQKLNQSNMDAIIKVKTAESQKKIDLLKSEIATEIDLIQNKNKKLKEIDDNLKNDQDAKEKRAVEFQKALSSQSKGGDFYRIANPEDFQAKYGTERNQVQDSFDLGTGAYKTYDAYAKKRQELGVSTYQYYSYLAENEKDSAKKDEYLRQAKAGADEFYEFIFNKSKETIENDSKVAAEKLKTNTAELAKEEAAQKEVIDNITKYFSDSSNQLRTDYVTSFRAFISDISPDISKLGVDTYNALIDAKKKADENDKEYSKITGNKIAYGSSATPSSSSPSSSTSTPVPTGRDTSTAPKTGETWDEMIARFKREDAEVTKANRRAAGIPVYEQGTPYVPETGIALIHKGERIIPAPVNAELMARGRQGFFDNRAANNNSYSTSSVNNYQQNITLPAMSVVIQGGDIKQVRTELEGFRMKLAGQLKSLGIG